MSRRRPPVAPGFSCHLCEISDKTNEEGLNKGIEFFQQAIEKDPSYALDYVGLADSYFQLGAFQYRPPKEVFPKAEGAALKALEIDIKT